MGPYHTDNGMYVLLTPSSILPLRSISKNGEVNLLNTDSSSVILLLGTGLTSWLLPERKLYAAPHGLPALATILSTAPRTVIARMRVAPPGSLPSGARKTSPTFTSHFAAPLESETGATLARLVRQRGTQRGTPPDARRNGLMHARAAVGCRAQSSFGTTGSQLGRGATLMQRVA